MNMTQEQARRAVDRRNAIEREQFEAARAAGRQASLYTPDEVIHVNVRLYGGSVDAERRYSRCQHKDLMGQCTQPVGHADLRHRIRWAGMGTVDL